MSGRTLRAGPATVEIPRDLVPCEPESRVEDDTVIVTCTLTEVPDILQDVSAPIVER
jgi:hypothetical protein